VLLLDPSAISEPVIYQPAPSVSANLRNSQKIFSGHSSDLFVCWRYAPANQGLQARFLKKRHRRLEIYIFKNSNLRAGSSNYDNCHHANDHSAQPRKRNFENRAFETLIESGKRSKPKLPAWMP
jgi:hypothetical protein